MSHQTHHKKINTIHQFTESEMFYLPDNMLFFNKFNYYQNRKKTYQKLHLSI